MEPDLTKRIKIVGFRKTAALIRKVSIRFAIGKAIAYGALLLSLFNTIRVM